MCPTCKFLFATLLFAFVRGAKSSPFSRIVYFIEPRRTCIYNFCIFGLFKKKEKKDPPNLCHGKKKGKKLIVYTPCVRENTRRCSTTKSHLILQQSRAQQYIITAQPQGRPLDQDDRTILRPPSTLSPSNSNNPAQTWPIQRAERERERGEKDRGEV